MKIIHTSIPNLRYSQKLFQTIMKWNLIVAFSSFGSNGIGFLSYLSVSDIVPDKKVALSNILCIFLNNYSLGGYSSVMPLGFLCKKHLYKINKSHLHKYSVIFIRYLVDSVVPRTYLLQYRLVVQFCLPSQVYCLKH